LVKCPLILPTETACGPVYILSKSTDSVCKIAII
jgi:hypothetical protein